MSVENRGRREWRSARRAPFSTLYGPMSVENLLSFAPAARSRGSFQYPLRANERGKPATSSSSTLIGPTFSTLYGPMSVENARSRSKRAGPVTFQYPLRANERGKLRGLTDAERLDAPFSTLYGPMSVENAMMRPPLPEKNVLSVPSTGQ